MATDLARVTLIDAPGAGPRLVADLLSSLVTGGASAAFRGLRFPVLLSKVSRLERAPRSVAHALGSLPGTTAPAWSRLADERARVYIGRSPTNAVVVSDMTVSKRHASIVRSEGERWSIVDEGSLNGTFLDGVKIKAGAAVALPTRLAVIRLGPEAELVVMDETTLRDYISSLRTDRDEREPALFAKVESRYRGALDAARRTWPGAAHQDPLAGAILRAVRSTPFPALRYRVVLENALVEDPVTWPALVELVERNAPQIITVEAVWASDRAEVVYDRNRSIDASRTRRVGRG